LISHTPLLGELQLPAFLSDLRSGLMAGFGTLCQLVQGAASVNYGLILLKSSSLIWRPFADSIAVLIGGFGDDGPKA